MQIEGAKRDKAARIAKAARFAAKFLDLKSAQIKIRFSFLTSEGEYSLVTREIQIDKTLEGDILFYTLFHEMVHLSQHVHGRLMLVGNVLKWDGGDIAEGYYGQPHEIQARKVGKELLEKFLAG